MEALGRDMQGDMRELISIPVQKVGSKIVRSKRGEAPRMETKKLRGSMTTSTVAGSDSVTTEMGSDESIADYSKYLEGGLDRPHFRTIFERVQQYAVDRITARLPQTI